MSVFNGSPVCPPVKSLEKSQLKSWLSTPFHPSPSFIILCFYSVFPFPFSCLPFALVATTARFAHYFPFSFILPRLLILCAFRKGLPAQEDNFFLLYLYLYSTRGSWFALGYFFPLSLLRFNRVKAKVVSITYIIYAFTKYRTLLQSR